MENPFLTNSYKGPDTFCDRKDETKELIQFIENGINVTLFAIRRLGKTGLIHHLFRKIENEKQLEYIYIDILPTQNLAEFTNQLATAIYNRFPQQKRIGKRISTFLKLFRPTLNFDELTGNPTLSIAVNSTQQQETTIQQLFQFLDSQSCKVVVAIDEFQQILEYPEKNTEALLRTYFQTLQNTSFIFCGSNQQLMHDIFNSSKRPFFASCSHIHLDFIEENEYADFIARKFAEGKQSISAESISFICKWTLRHTFYTQYLCNQLYYQRRKKIELSDVRKMAWQILKQHEGVFFQYRNLLTDGQWKLLKAIGKEEKVFQPNSKEFIQKYQLGSASIVSRSLEALLQKEMIYLDAYSDKPYYQVYDKFLLRWIQSN
jgi:AAA+ ATPase superfamily predicted ATPase